MGIIQVKKAAELQNGVGNGKVVDKTVQEEELVDTDAAPVDEAETVEAVDADETAASDDAAPVDEESDTQEQKKKPGRRKKNSNQ